MKQYCNCPKGTDSRHPCAAHKIWCNCCDECHQKCLMDWFSDTSDMETIIDLVERDLRGMVTG